MSTEQTLTRIDDALPEWDEWDGESRDAARWQGGPDESEWPDEQPPEGPLRAYLLTPSGWQEIGYTSDGFAYDAVEPSQRSFQCPAMPMRSMIEFTIPPEAKRQLVAAIFGADIAKLLFGSPAPPTSSADRTHSPRWRAGTRRTKQHARKRRQRHVQGRDG